MRKILHIDADCFYAAIEMRENPSLKNTPIVVGGAPDKRGVVATCNYEARKYGVRSAMPSAHAKRLCPHLQFISPRIAHYKTYSMKMREIFTEYSNQIEPLSLDEAYLDVSDTELCRGSGTLIAEEIRHRIYADLGITVSAGIAPAKFLAKIASDWKKPNGIFTISPSGVDSFLKDLPVSKLPGVGPVANKRFARAGLYTCGDVREYGLPGLVKLVGGFAPRVFQMSQGEDHRQVSKNSERKSISVENTFDVDYVSMGDLRPHFEALFLKLINRVSYSKVENRIEKVVVKLKFNDFTTTTVETSLRKSIVDASDLFERLLMTAWKRKAQPIRLLGVGVRLGKVCKGQLAFKFTDDQVDGFAP